MSNQIQFRIIVGSYEHSLLCLSLTLPIQKDDEKPSRQPIFQPIFHFPAHSLSIRAMDIAKRYLVTGSNDEHIKIYDLQKRKELGTLLQHQGSITKLVFSNETKVIKSEEDDDEGEEGLEDDGENECLSHKSGKWLLSAAEDGKIIIWRTKDWEQFGILKGHTGTVNDLSIHPSGRVAISISTDKTLRLWNLMTAKKASSLKLKGINTLGQTPTICKFNIVGDSIVVGLMTRIMLYKTRDAKVNRIFKFKQTLMALDFVMLDNVEYLILAFGNGSICFYDYSKLENQKLGDEEQQNPDSNELVLELGEPEFQLQGHANRVKGFSIYQEQSIDKRIITYLVSISSDGKIVVWDMDKKDQVAVYDTGERLNVVSTVNESIEKANSMKPRFDPTKESLKNLTESEYESDGESLAHLMKGDRKKKSKKQLKKQKKKMLSVELEN
ncbi:hypothetical protein CANARDRAFT_203312 [[Candida] arabinofermentans NRRL YB-2248]|uniref:Anaphase-promoting complex subunit 4 WD40 domain-containing protein n=1 Tax=[Candida] arabinofermentans NRRL YB-2248 TaxID=983967 RepID=A0A1E4SV71_9ASCO|nr:hypothetical protein CANARDRAFT_203312 [[Candida] arabinofermentans NRRL YB-2248]